MIDSEIQPQQLRSDVRNPQHGTIWHGHIPRRVIGAVSRVWGVAVEKSPRRLSNHDQHVGVVRLPRHESRPAVHGDHDHGRCDDSDEPKSAPRNRSVTRRVIAVRPADHDADDEQRQRRCHDRIGRGHATRGDRKLRPGKYQNGQRHSRWLGATTDAAHVPAGDEAHGVNVNRKVYRASV